jgi:acetyltransferase (GNAT) family protein
LDAAAVVAQTTAARVGFQGGEAISALFPALVDVRRDILLWVRDRLRGHSMLAYEILTEEKKARDFFQLVQDHLYWEAALLDETAPHRVAIQRRLMPPLDLFSRRGSFIAAVVATEQDNIVGLYLMADQLGMAHVDAGYVVSKCRRRGIGYELLQRSCGYLLECGRRPVYLDIRTVEMVRLVVKLKTALPPDTLLVSVSLDPAAKDLNDDLYQ